MIDSYFINLDSAADRRRFMEEQAETIGLALRRMAAVRAADIDPALLATQGRSWERPLSAAEMACFLSHRNLWQIVAAGEKPVLVLEDDAVLSPRLPAVLEAITGLKGVEFLNLEDFGKRRFVGRRGALPILPGVAAVPLARDKAGSAAYVLWPAGARRLLALAAVRAAPADAFLHAESGMRAFICEPAMAIQQHVLEKRDGLSSGAASSVQASRARLPLTFANLPFVARRLRTQLRLLPKHFGRLGPLQYRKVSFDRTSPKDTIV